MHAKHNNLRTLLVFLLGDLEANTFQADWQYYCLKYNLLNEIKVNSKIHKICLNYKLHIKCQWETENNNRRDFTITQVTISFIFNWWAVVSSTQPVLHSFPLALLSINILDFIPSRYMQCEWVCKVRLQLGAQHHGQRTHMCSPVLVFRCSCCTHTLIVTIWVPVNPQCPYSE